MKKYRYICSVLLILGLVPLCSFPQQENIYNLNFYKGIVVDRSSVQSNAITDFQAIERIIKEKISRKSIYVYDRFDINLPYINRCDLLTCTFSSTNNQNVIVILTFTDCQNKIVYSIRFESSYRNRNQRNVERAFEGALEVFDKFEYRYSNIMASKYQTFDQNNEITKDVQSLEVDLSNGVLDVRSDVAVNIPKTNVNNDNTFAVIIANENYQRPSPNVDYAINDGSIFKEYCEKTLGIPESNIWFYTDATSGVIDNAINRLTNIAKAFENEAKIIFYYAGHGTLDQSADRAPYLLPVDVNPNNLRLAVKLEELYDRLSEHPTENVLVFLDACFSGSNRGEGMVAEGGRFVVDEPRFEPIKGNMVVFSAASGKETAWPYKDKQHGLFTYYLLKKLQETKGDVSLKQLADYIEENVSRRSTVLDNKQTPQTIVSPYMGDSWKNMKLR